MDSLSLGLLGPFHSARDGRSISGLTAGRLRALLAYLAVEADRVHLRQTLADFFFPESSQTEANNQLRYALSNLRTLIGDREASPPFLTITRETLQFNLACHYWLDTELFEALGCEDDAGRLAQAVSVYRGPFLEGVVVDNSEPFEQWMSWRREQYERLMLSILRRLVAQHEQRGDYEQALANARRQLEMDPWLESAHRQVMRALALSGQRGAALSHYHACERVLAEELGAEPEDETNALYERIRLGQLADTQALGQYHVRPPVLTLGPTAPDAPFVGRADELARLDAHLEASIAGRGRVVFVVGGPGGGKTALLNEFAVRTAAMRDDVVIAAGCCSIFGHADDFSYPACQIVNQLVGNREFSCSEFSFDRDDIDSASDGQGDDDSADGDHAFALGSSDLTRTMIEILTEVGPNLLDVYVPVPYLISATNKVERWPRGSGSRDEWIRRLLAVANADSAGQADGRAGVHRYSADGLNLPGGLPSALRSSQLQQLIRVIASLAQRRPLILLLDNLQWSDTGTLRFLHQLGAHVASCRILVIGAYRPNELVADGRASAGSDEFVTGPHLHPLQHVVMELQRRYGDITIDLDESDPRIFVGKFLGLAPNCFEDSFIERFTRQTAGNPLLAGELWQDFVAKKGLVRDAAGRWTEGPRLDWEAISERARAAIEEVIVGLPQSWQEMLAIASVQGDLFCAEVVASVAQASVDSVIRILSGPLSHEHCLLRAVSVAHVYANGNDTGPCMSMYHFRHHLYQVYLYHSLDEIRRMRHHESVGRALEAIYQDCDSELRKVAPQLAYHFEEAGMPGRAAEYRNSQDAGSRLR